MDWFTNVPVQGLNNEPLVALSTVLMGVAVAWASWTFISIVTRRILTSAESWEFEKSRRIRLRKENPTYRWFEPLVGELAEWNRRQSTARVEKVRDSLAIVSDKAPWKPEEYLAMRQIEGIAFACVFAVILLALGSAFVAVIIGAAIAFAYQELTVKSICDHAVKRKADLRKRLPFAIDLMALMMEAGATFLDSLETVVRENADHPLGEELGEVARQVSLGRPRSEALEELHERVGDYDLSELIFAINKGEELGTPLSNILRSQADQMRLKRSQWGEKAAAEAQVKITFPGMLIMIACLIVIMAPILLPVMFEFL